MERFPPPTFLAFPGFILLEWLRILFVLAYSPDFYFIHQYEVKPLALSHSSYSIQIYGPKIDIFKIYVPEFSLFLIFVPEFCYFQSFLWSWFTIQNSVPYLWSSTLF